MNSQETQNWNRISQLVHEGTQIDAFEFPAERAAVQTFYQGHIDHLTIEILSRAVQRKKHQIETGHCPPFRAPKRLRGEIILGTDHKNIPVLIQSYLLLQGLGIWGSTGSGKTTLLLYILLQIAQQGYPVWLADMERKDLRRILLALQEKGIPLSIIRADQFAFNPLQSTHLDPKDHHHIVTDLLEYALGLGGRAVSICRKAIFKLYAKFGIWSGQREHWPTLMHLYDHIRDEPGLNVASRDAILDRLGVLILTLGAEVLSFYKGLSPHELAKHNVLFEFWNVIDAAKKLILNWYLFGFYLHQVNYGIPNQGIKLFFAGDDCQGFLANQGSFGGLPPLSRFAGVCRSPGIALAFLSQSFESFPKDLIPNLNTKIVGHLGSAYDHNYVAANFRLNKEASHWASLNLGPQNYLAHLGSSAWKEPFLLKIPKVSFPKSVSDQQAAASFQRLSKSMPTIRCEEYRKWTPFSTVQVSTASPRASLTQREWTFIFAIVDNPLQPATSYAHMAGLNGSKASALRKRLVSDGWIRERKMSKSARGRTSLMLEPTQIAINAVAAKRSSNP